jgi:guanylate kinase
MTTTPPAGLVLYGPPAVGKSTVTSTLNRLDRRFKLFPIVKAGPGRSAGYTLVTAARFAAAAAAGDFIASWSRYGARYALSAPSLTLFARTGRIPVVHLGAVDILRAVTSVPTFRWTVIQLWATRDVCKRRARERQTADLPARLAAYDSTTRLTDDQAHLTLETDDLAPARAARIIRAAVFHPRT